MYYKIIDYTGTDEFESKVYTDKEEAIRDASSEWDCLSQHDKDRRERFYVGAFEHEDDFECVDVVYEACWK